MSVEYVFPAPKPTGLGRVARNSASSTASSSLSSSSSSASDSSSSSSKLGAATGLRWRGPYFLSRGKAEGMCDVRSLEVCENAADAGAGAAAVVAHAAGGSSSCRWSGISVFFSGEKRPRVGQLLIVIVTGEQIPAVRCLSQSNPTLHLAPASPHFPTSPVKSHLAAGRLRSAASGLPPAPPPLGPSRIMLRIHSCPRVYPPPPLPAVCRQSAASSPAPKRCFPPAVRAQNPPRRAAVTPAASGELQRGQVEDDDLGEDLGEALARTRQLVECAMFAAVAGLAYFLSNSLAIENYFGCFFPLPVVISSLRWGLDAGRKTVVATVLLLFTLSGPVKASTYLLMHGVVGLAMGTIWSLETNWIVSIILCSINKLNLIQEFFMQTRALGACGYVLVSSFLIRENILALITVNIHASLTYILAAAGVNTIPSMDAIYVLFGALLLLNCGFFIFLLHIMYTVFLTKLGIKSSLRSPRWLDKVLLMSR
ncbi:hypothetical protein EJB05_23984, partial [Eragrostis curvula]